MFENGFPREWSTIKKLALLFRAVVNAIAPVLKTVTGAIIHITDALARPAQSLKVNFSAIQAGTGAPSPDNVRPISGWTECKVTRTGKNFVSTQPVLTTNTTQTIVDFGKDMTISCTLSFDADNLTFGSSAAAIFDFRKSDGTHAYRTPSNFYRASDNQQMSTAEQPINGKIVCKETNITFRYLVCYFMSASYGMYSGLMKNVQLELGSTATAYEPYQGQTYTIDLDGTRYGGTLDVTSGKLIVTHKYIGVRQLTGTWVKSTNYPGGFYIDAGANGFKASTPFICSHAATALSLSDYLPGTCFCDNALSFRIMPAGSSVQDWLDYLDAQIANDTPVTMCGEMATPIEVQLTPTEITLFAGENNMWSDANGTIELTYLADGNVSEIEALNILLGGQYSNNHEADEPTDREALNILLGGNER